MLGRLNLSSGAPSARRARPSGLRRTRTRPPVVLSTSLQYAAARRRPSSGEDASTIASGAYARSSDSTGFISVVLCLGDEVGGLEWVSVQMPGPGLLDGFRAH